MSLFKVSVEINCETEQEILSHLHAIRQRIKNYLKDHSEIDVVPMSFEDNNCYGTHEVTIDIDRATDKGAGDDYPVIDQSFPPFPPKQPAAIK